MLPPGIAAAPGARRPKMLLRARAASASRRPAASLLYRHARRPGNLEVRAAGDAPLQAYLSEWMSSACSTADGLRRARARPGMQSDWVTLQHLLAEPGAGGREWVATQQFAFFPAGDASGVRYCSCACAANSGSFAEHIGQSVKPSCTVTHGHGRNN